MGSKSLTPDICAKMLAYAEENGLLILGFISIIYASMKSLLDTLHKHVYRPQTQWTVEHKDGLRYWTDDVHGNQFTVEY